jgi:N-acetylneuraminic acid mutarotase
MGEGSKLLDSIAIYDPRTSRWHHGAPIPTPRDHLAAAQVGGRVYAIGGRPLDPDRNFNKLEIYDPKTDSWAEGPPMLSARGGLAAAVLDGSIHTFGGETTHSVFEEHEVYDVGAGAWRSAPSLPTPRHGLAAAALGGRIYVVGGGPRAGLAQTSIVEVFNPKDCVASQCSVSSSGN